MNFGEMLEFLIKKLFQHQSKKFLNNKKYNISESNIFLNEISGRMNLGILRSVSCDIIGKILPIKEKVVQKNIWKFYKQYETKC